MILYRQKSNVLIDLIDSFNIHHPSFVGCFKNAAMTLKTQLQAIAVFSIVTFTNTAIGPPIATFIHPLQAETYSCVLLKTWLQTCFRLCLKCSYRYRFGCVLKMRLKPPPTAMFLKRGYRFFFKPKKKKRVFFSPQKIQI